MPEKNQSTRVASRARRNLHRGKNKKRSGRKKIGGPAPAPDRVIANSLFALTLQPKALAGIASEIGDPKKAAQYEVMYKDLLTAYNNGARILKIPTVKLEKRTDYIRGVSEVLAAFKNHIVPKGFDVNIDEHTKKGQRSIHYHFTVYKHCSFPERWHFFELKPLVKKLKAENEALHDLFISFISSFIDKCTIPTWYNGGMNYTEMHLPDYLFQIKDRILWLEKTLKSGKAKDIQYDPWTENPPSHEELEKAIKRKHDVEALIEIYNSGEPRQYAKLLIETKFQKPESILKQLKKFPYQNSVVKLIKQGCELMMDKARLVDFCYSHEIGFWEEGLEFDSQVTIIWDWQDHYTKCFIEGVDSLAQGCGVFPPTLHARFIPDKFHLDWKAFLTSDGWPTKLSALCDTYFRITEKLSDYNNESDDE